VSDRIVLKLTKPITFGEQVIDELALREPKAKDFRRMPMNPALGDLLDFAGQLAGQPKAVIDELGPVDMLTVLQRVGDFFPGGPVTGGTPLQ
jgi:hypothetical protein